MHDPKLQSCIPKCDFTKTCIHLFCIWKTWLRKSSSKIRYGTCHWLCLLYYTFM